MTARKNSRGRSPGPVIVGMLAGAALLYLIVTRLQEADAPVPANPIASPTRTPMSDPSPGDEPAVLRNEPVTPVDEEELVIGLVSEGNDLLAQGQAESAAERFKRAIEISPEQEDLHYNLGIALVRMGKAEEAKIHYIKALEIFPDYAEAHNNLGNLLMSEGKLAEAVEHLKQAVNNLPESSAFHNNLGTALARQGKTAEALAEFEEAASLNPKFVEARVNLATALLATGQTDKAIDQLNEALRLKPDFAPALHVLQRAQQRQASSPR